MEEHIYRITAKGTAWELQHKEGVLCLVVIGGLYYSPELHVVFQRFNNIVSKEYEYSWDYATFPSYDKRWEEIQKNPFWKTHICNVDGEVLTFTDEEAL